MDISDYLRGTIRISVEPQALSRLKPRHIEELQRMFNVSMKVDRRGGTVEINPTERATLDQVLKIRDVVNAILLGFRYEDALLLEREDYALHVIDLKEYTDKENHLTRIKGRLIGEDGRARRAMEHLSETRIVVGDRYVAVLGPIDNVFAARDAIEMLIHGKKHGTVYKKLNRWRQDRLRRETLGF